MAIMNNHYKVLLYKNFKNAERYEWACHVTYLDSFVIVIIVQLQQNYYVLLLKSHKKKVCWSCMVKQNVCSLSLVIQIRVFL